jgi:hypothetical protein
MPSPGSSVFPMAAQFLRALLSVALLFVDVAGGAVHRSTSSSLECHHRSSALVQGWADACIYKLPGGFLAPCGAVYVGALAGHDRHCTPVDNRRSLPARCPARCQAPPALYVPRGRGGGEERRGVGREVEPVHAPVRHTANAPCKSEYPTRTALMV